MKIFKLLRWSAVWTATWTMLITPVALGEEAKKVSKQQMQAAITELGLNKKITWGEFYSKNKHLIPVRVQEKIEPFIASFKNQLVPGVEVLSSKTTSGEEIATLRLSQGSELLSIQWFGEHEKMFKFQNSTISEIDVINFDDMFTHVFAGDEKYRKQLGYIKSKPTSKVKKSIKYPDVTKAEWKSMSAYDKANYIVNLRLLWQDARKVLKEKEKLSNKKTSMNFFEKNKHFYALFFGQGAEAVEQSNNTCIVAGYVTNYITAKNGHKYCSPKSLDKTYGNLEIYKSAKNFCGVQQIACNPLIFGAPNGEPKCVKTTDDSFQIATHWEGECDKASRLSESTDKREIVKDKKDQARYEDGNLLLSDEQRKELFKTEQGEKNYRLTEQYILGLLKFKGKSDKNAKSLFDSNGAISDEMLESIKTIKNEFDNEINKAKESCQNESKTKSGLREKNYWEACDQLHRRYLFLEELLKSKCEKGSNFNPETWKCICAGASPAPTTPGSPLPVAPAPEKPPMTPVKPTPADQAPALPGIVDGGSKPPEVCPGAKCSAVTPDNGKPGSDSSDENCESKYPGAVGMSDKCLCSNGKAPALVATDGATEQESYECTAASDGKSKKPKEECGFWCKYGSKIKTAALWVGGGILAYFLFKQLTPKKPKLNAPPDLCPNGQPAPCPQICAPPKKNQSNGTCGCDGCPPGQSADPTTCYCSTGTTPGAGQTYLCPDSVTRVGDLADCPTYACWNGQSYQNPMNCPPAPATTTSPTGTAN